MKKRTFSEAQIDTALRQIDAGAPVLEVTRKLEISEADVRRLAETVRPDGHRRDSAVATTKGREQPAQVARDRYDVGYGDNLRFSELRLPHGNLLAEGDYCAKKFSFTSAVIYGELT